LFLFLRDATVLVIVNIFVVYNWVNIGPISQMESCNILLRLKKTLRKLIFLGSFEVRLVLININQLVDHIIIRITAGLSFIAQFGFVSD